MKIKQTKTIKINYILHKELLAIKKRLGYKRISSVIEYLINR